MIMMIRALLLILQLYPKPFQNQFLAFFEPENIVLQAPKTLKIYIIWPGGPVPSRKYQVPSSFCRDFAVVLGLFLSRCLLFLLWFYHLLKWLLCNSFCPWNLLNIPSKVFVLIFSSYPHWLSLPLPRFYMLFLVCLCFVRKFFWLILSDLHPARWIILPVNSETPFSSLLLYFFCFM